MSEWEHIDPWANESKATLRYLQKRSGKDFIACLAALRSAKGDIPGAIRNLAPTLPVYKYPDWYYISLGPNKKVEDPDRDLPVKEWEDSGPPACDTERSSPASSNGERWIPPFRDGNTLSDILGCLLVASGYPRTGDPRLREMGCLQMTLAHATDRIREKLRRNRSPLRARYFEDAVRAIELAKDAYFDHDYAKGEVLLWQAQRLLSDSNKQGRA